MVGCLTPLQARLVNKVAHNLSKKSAYWYILSLMKMPEIQGLRTFGSLTWGLGGKGSKAFNKKH